MPDFPPQLLTHWTGGTWTSQPAGALSGFCIDSRQLRAGQVFVALKTDKRDGHDFLAGAAAAGASAAIVATPNPTIALPQLVVADPLKAFQSIAREHRRRFTGRVVGISGSAGKTSTKDLLALLLGGDTCGVPAAEDSGSVKVERDVPIALTAAEQTSPMGTWGSTTAAFTGRVLATEGNLNNHLGVPLTLTRLDPSAHDFAVIEAGISAPGEMRPLAEMIEPDVALITLIAPAHTAELGGLEGAAREKAQLPAATRTAGVAVFSHETAQYAAFRDLSVHTMIVERADVIRPAQPPKDTVYFTLTQRDDETAIALAYGEPPPLVFSFRRVSDGMAQNAALAICTALWLGVPIPLVQQRLRAWQPAQLRGEIRREDGRLVYVDCYNANPASMADALATFDAIAPKSEPRLYIIGCMEELGNAAAGYHRALGSSLELRRHDEAFLIGTFAHEIREGGIEAGDAGAQLHVVASVDDVVDVVRGWRGSVFVKGSRRYQLEKVVAPLGAGTEVCCHH